MSRRGHALPLMMTVLAALSVTSTVLYVRIDARIEDRREDALRGQARWLARSAALAGRGPGTHQLAIGSARFEVQIASVAPGRARAVARLLPRGYAAWTLVERGADGGPRISAEGEERFTE